MTTMNSTTSNTSIGYAYDDGYNATWMSLLQSTSEFNNTNITIVRSSGVSGFYPIIVTEMILSIIALSIIIFVYSVLPECKNVHGKNLISLSSCLLVAFTFLILDLLLRNTLSATFCYAFALIIHFTFLASFFWTNVMAFDICRTMTVLKPKSEHKSSNKYLKYSVYAWTAAALTALPAAVLDKTDWIDKDYRPNFGVKRCWLSGTRAFVMYFNAPVGFLLFSNLVMFGLTIWSLIKIKKMTDKMQIKQQREQFKLYVKLLLVVGVIWLTEFLPWATGIYRLYALAGILTSVHGVLLFLIFVCKRRILRQIWKRYDVRWGSKFFEPKGSSSTQSSSMTACASNGSISKV